MLTTLPLLLRRRERHARVISQVPRTLTAITRSQVSTTSSSSVRPPEFVIAALLTNPSSRSSLFATSPMEASEERSRLKERTRSVRAVSCTDGSMSAITTSAPEATAASAKARPRPRAPPVMRTVLLRRLIQGLELRAGLCFEEPAHAHHAGIVLVERFSAARLGRQVLEE